MACLAATVSAAAVPLVRRGTVDSDQIVGFPDTVPSDMTGQVYMAYQPLLSVENGCVPFPGVDAEGNTK